MKKINYLLVVLLSMTLFIGCKPTETDVKPDETEAFMASTTPSNRVAVLEDFTGVRCGYCPDGHVRAKAVEDANPGKFIIMAVHAGGYAAPAAGWANFTTPYGNPIDAQSDVAGYPAGTINRIKAADLGQVPQSAGYVAPRTPHNNGLAMSRGSWAGAAAKIFAMAAPVNIGASATYDAATKKITVKVDMYYTSSETVPNNINVALLQDGLISKQSGGTPDPNAYVQNHVLRDMATGNWGEVITEPTTSGSKIKGKTYTFTVPDYYNGNNAITGGGAAVVDKMKVVVFVSRGKTDILNAIEIDVK